MASEIQIQSPGRPVYPGQLYNAVKPRVLNPERIPSTFRLRYNLSISVLCGAVAVDGFGSYLDREAIRIQ